MSLIEQLLRDKGNLSGVALANAKALIRRFVDEVAEVLRTEVEKSSTGTLDRSVPPKRVFRNLDLDRTIWKNLTNWSPEEERLYELSQNFLCPREGRHRALRRDHGDASGCNWDLVPRERQRAPSGRWLVPL